jgi:hypothetical protein
VLPLKLVPLTIKVKAEPVAVAAAGEIDCTIGAVRWAKTVPQEDRMLRSIARIMIMATR